MNSNQHSFDLLVTSIESLTTQLSFPGYRLNVHFIKRLVGDIKSRMIFIQNTNKSNVSSLYNALKDMTETDPEQASNALRLLFALMGLIVSIGDMKGDARLFIKKDKLLRTFLTLTEPHEKL